MPCEGTLLGLVTLYSEPNCEGQVLDTVRDWLPVPLNFKSLSVPANARLTLVKSDVKLDFARKLWGDFIDDTTTSFERFDGLVAGVSFADLDFLQASYDYDLDVIKACAGLDTTTTEPISNCDQLLDLYCAGSGDYVQELCAQRSISGAEVPEIHTRTKITPWFCCVILLGVLCFVAWLSSFGKYVGLQLAGNKKGYQ